MKSSEIQGTKRKGRIGCNGQGPRGTSQGGNSNGAKFA